MSISGMTSHNVRTVFAAFALTLPLLIIACDPGMTIRQADSRTETGKRSSVILHVKSTRQLIGDTRYIAQVTVTNASERSAASGSNTYQKLRMRLIGNWTK